MDEISLTTHLEAEPSAVFAALLDQPGQCELLDHMERVEVLEQNEQDMLVRMHEIVDGAQVTVTSRFRFQPDEWVTYEHVESPFGENRGRFEIVPRTTGCDLKQTHSTEQDLDAVPTLRDDWTRMMASIHSVVGQLASP